MPNRNPTPIPPVCVKRDCFQTNKQLVLFGVSVSFVLLSKAALPAFAALRDMLLQELQRKIMIPAVNAAPYMWLASWHPLDTRRCLTCSCVTVGPSCSASAVSAVVVHAFTATRSNLQYGKRLQDRAVYADTTGTGMLRLSDDGGRC